MMIKTKNVTVVTSGPLPVLNERHAAAIASIPISAV
jgi:hypothetical protein